MTVCSHDSIRPYYIPSSRPRPLLIFPIFASASPSLCSRHIHHIFHAEARYFDIRLNPKADDCTLAFGYSTLANHSSRYNASDDSAPVTAFIHSALFCRLQPCLQSVPTDCFLQNYPTSHLPLSPRRT